MGGALSRQELEAAHCWEKDDEELLAANVLPEKTTAALCDRYLPS